ncbi:hypothetical protein [Empedobacter sedimenti]|uniref:hypothetical protein n=1 Tax=Empedobacter sedimenti TaxID=3042610 RepID=UPI0024A6137C|nr:hypothetical protein [Empedobacter sedimenti]
MKILAQIITKYNADLSRVRLDEKQLKHYLYSKKIDKNGIPFDENTTKRHRIILALLSDKKVEDESIIVQLFKAEIKEHQSNVDQGLSASMSRNAFLLASFNRVEHLDLFIKANASNNDTFYEFNENFLLWNGIENSYKHIEKLNKKSQEFFYQKFGKTSATCIYTDNDIQNWKTKLSDYYARFFKNENFEDEFHLLLDIEEKKAAQKLLSNWKKKQALKDDQYWKKLAKYYEYLNDFERQIKAYKKLIQLSESKTEKLVYNISLADLYLQQKDADGLLTCTTTYLSMKYKVKKLGIWLLTKVRNQCLAFILLKNDKKNKDAIQLWNWLKPLLAKQKDLNHYQLEDIAKVYDLFGNDKKSKEYLQKAKQEKAKWN